MRVISDTQIVQGFYGWHVWSVNRKAYIPNLLNNNKKTPKLFQPLFCLIVLSFVFMHTCFIGVEILAPQMANWTKRKKKKKNKVINYFFFLFVELPFVSMHPLPQLMRKPRAEGRWSWDKRPSVQGSTSAFFLLLLKQFESIWIVWNKNKIGLNTAPIYNTPFSNFTLLLLWQ